MYVNCKKNIEIKTTVTTTTTSEEKETAKAGKHRLSNNTDKG